MCAPPPYPRVCGAAIPAGEATTYRQQLTAGKMGAWAAGGRYFRNMLYPYIAAQAAAKAIPTG